LTYRRIGLDLDHTLIDYSGAIQFLARARGLNSASKSRVKSYYQESEHGDVGWQEFQAQLYSEGLQYARLMPGVESFLKRASTSDIDVFIISHKTEYAPRGNQQISLREVSTAFLKHHDLIPHLVPPERVFYAATREEKVQQVSSLGLDVFVDDLPEVLAHPLMPKQVWKVLIDPEEAHTQAPFHRVVDFADIESLVFSD
jgi:hypothetical protein